MDKPTLHLLTTSLCLRNCKHCCNKQYDLNSVPYASKKDFISVEEVCLTGGEPVIFSDVNCIASYLKQNYKNIKKVYVYANAVELYLTLKRRGINPLVIDGISLSIKRYADVEAFKAICLFGWLREIESVYVYVFDNLISEKDIPDGWKFIKREWQEKFKPAPNSIFRKI